MFIETKAINEPVQKLTQVEMEKFQKYGQNAADVLEFLSESVDFIQSIKTTLGIELQRDLVMIMQDRLRKIIAETATEQDKAEFRVAERWQKILMARINAYTKGVNTVKTQSINGGTANAGR